MTIEEQARKLGISVYQLKQRLKQKREDEAAKRARRDLHERGVGWNPRSGNKRRNKGV